MDRDPKPSFTKKAKGVGLAFLGALSLGGFAGDAGAQSRASNYDGWELSPRVLADCVENDQRQWDRVKAGQEPNFGDVCGGDQNLIAVGVRLINERLARETPAQRRDRETAQERTMRESDELSRYCESVNFVGERCRGL